MSASSTRLDWDDLRLVLAVAEIGTISGAAEALRISHPTLSRRLKRMEERLGTRLFERTPSLCRPTEAGSEVRDLAERMRAEIAVLETRVAGRDLRPEGVVRLTAPDAVSDYLLPDMLAEICRATLGDDAYFFYDQYVVKGADKGMPFSWHQDSGYVVGNGGPVDHKPYLTCWCALDDTTVANGTVRIMPFSQAPETRDGIVPHLRQPGSNDLVGYTGDGEGVTLEVPAGSIVAFSSLALHATGSNSTPNMRRVYLAQYSPEPILNPGTRHLRRNAIAFLRGGTQVTFN